MNLKKCFLPTLLIVLLISTAHAANWPEFGGNTDRSFTTTETLAFPLTNDWVYQCDHSPEPSFKGFSRGALEPIWAAEMENVMKLDYVSYPVVSGKSVCFADVTDSSVVCLDTDSGVTNWVFSTGGPVRVPPVISNGKVYFGSDDGSAYCLDLTDGSKVWTVSGAPEESQFIASGKMISRYPVRTSVTVDDGIAYFGAGLFPQQGVWLRAVNALTGAPVWTEKIEYTANGMILIDEEKLFLPAGRASPTEWLKADGSFVSTQPRFGRRSGGAAVINKVGDMLAYHDEMENVHVRTVDSSVENDDRQYVTISGDLTGFGARQMIANDSAIFIIQSEKDGALTGPRSVIALSTNFYTSLIESSARAGEWSDPKSGKFVPLMKGAYASDSNLYSDLTAETLWSESFTNDCFSIISAGSHVIAGSRNSVRVMDAVTGSNVWEQAVDGDVHGLAVADGALFAATTDGKVYCFRQTPGSGTDRIPSFSNPYASNAAYEEAAALAVTNSSQTNGFCLILGAGEGGGQLAYEIAQRSGFLIVGVEDDDTKRLLAISNLRQAGLYGTRVMIVDKSTDSLPAMFANLILSEEALETGTLPGDIDSVLKRLKPYNGVILLGAASTLDLSSWTMTGLSSWSDPGGSEADWQLATRGALSGGGVWDHYFGNPGNTFCTEDIYVNTNLVFQWVGPEGAADAMDRHYQAMPPLFRNGKMLYAGRETSLTCSDPYNGAVLWSIDIDDMIRKRVVFVNGFLCMDDEFVYAAAAGTAKQIDLDDGNIDATFTIPDAESGYDWGLIAVQSNRLYGSKIKEEASVNSFSNIDILINKETARPVVAKSIFALDATNSRTVIWNYETNSVIINSSVAFGDGSIFFAESYNTTVVNDSDGCVDLNDFFSNDAWLVSLDAVTGYENWRRPLGSTGGQVTHMMYLMYKNSRLIAQRGYGTFDGTSGTYELIGYAGSTGNPVWTNTITTDETSSWPLKGTKNKLFMHPTIVGNKLYLHRNNFNDQMRIMDITTGARTDHTYKLDLKTCAPKPASASTLFYRRTTMEAYDIASTNRAKINEVTRSSCWASAIPCGGLLMMPEGGSGCECGTPYMFSAAMAPREDPGITLISTVSFMSVPEGGSAPFGVKLSSQPTSTVTVTVSKVYDSDDDLTVTGGSSLSFTTSNWSSNQTVTLSASNDLDSIEGTATIRCSATGLSSVYVTASEQEPIPAEIELTTSSLSVPEGSTNSFGIRLTAQPGAETTVTVAYLSGDTNLTLQSGTNLLFTTTNWMTNQYSTIAAADDVDIANSSAVFRCSAEGMTPQELTATELDNDFPELVVSTTAIDVPEESTASFTVRLTSIPPGDWTVTTAVRAGGDVNISVSGGASLIFTTNNWGTNQLVTLSASDDEDLVSGVATVRCSAVSATPVDVIATEDDNDAPEVWEPKVGVGPETNVWRRLVVYGDQWSRHELAGHNGEANLWRNGYNTYIGETSPGDYLVLSNDFYDADNDGSTDDGYVAYLAFSETNRLSMSEWPTAGIYPTPINWRFYGGISWNVSDSTYGDQGFCLEQGMNADHQYIMPESVEDHPLQGQPYSLNPNSKLKTYWSILWMKDDFLNGASDGEVSIGSNSRLSMFFNRYWIGIDTARFIIKDSGQYYVHDNALSFQFSGGQPYHFVLNPTNTLWAEYNPSGYDIRFETNQTFDIDANTFTNIEAVGFHIAKDSDTSGMFHTKWYNFEADAYVKKNFRPSEHIDMVEVSAGGGVQDFYMSSCEVPYKLWNDIYRYADSVNAPNEARYNFVKDGDMGSMQFGSLSHGNQEPAVNFSVYDMAVWCNALSEKEGLTPCFYADTNRTIIFKNTNIATRAIETKPTRNLQNPEYTIVPDGPIYMDWDADGYRPPTPAEWERAYTAGGQSTGDADAWKANNALGQTHAVGLKSTNSLGLYDLVGNAWEFTWIHGDSYVPGSSNSHMAVGGGLQYPNDPQSAANSASPYGDRPFEGRYDVGLRLVRRAPGLATPATGTVPSGADALDTAGVHKWKFSSTYQTSAGTPPATSNMLNLVSIPSNTFLRAPEWHEISIKPFEMSQNEISYERWLAVYFWAIDNGYTFDMDGCMGSMRWWDFTHTSDEPVVAIPWHDMLVWCNALSKMEGRDPVYYTDDARNVEYTNTFRFRKNNIDMSVLAANNGTGYFDNKEREPWIFANWANDGYRLPTLAEWECAARGGLEQQDYMWGSNGALYTNYVWEIRNSGGRTHPVGQLQTNGYGLYDIQGNAAEALWSAERGTIERDYLEDLDNPKGSRYWGWQLHEDIYAPQDMPYVAGYSFFWANGLKIEDSIPAHNKIYENHNASDTGFRVVRCQSNTHPTNGLETLTPFIQLTFDTNDFSLLQGRCSQGSLNRNGQYDQAGISSNAAVGWTFDLGGPVKSSPVTVNGVVYVGGSDGFYAVEALTGTKLWKVSIPSGVESSVCVVDGVVYFGANDEKMYACDTTDGTVKWSVDTGEPIVSPVAVAYSNVFAAVGRTVYGFSVVDGSNTYQGSVGNMYPRAAVTLTEEYVVYGHGSSMPVIALKLQSGLLNGGGFEGDGSYSRNSTAVQDGMIYQAFAGGTFTGGDKQYAGLRAGPISNMYDTLWSEIVGGHLTEALRSATFSHPGIWNDQVILGADSGALYAYDKADGTCQTNYFTAGGPIRSPITVSTTDDMVYFGSWDDKIYGIDAATGTKKWEVTTGGNVDTAVCVDNERLYVGSDDGLLYCLESVTGGRIMATPDTVGVPEGSTTTFDIVLSEAPVSGSTTVMVSRYSADTNISVQGQTEFIFTSGNWMSNQTVTLAAEQDDDLQSDFAIIRCASDTAVDEYVMAFEAEDDLNIQVSPTAINVDEGGTETYSVRLTADPLLSIEVTSGHYSGDTDLTVSNGLSLTFDSENWSAWQTVTVAAGHDDDLTNATAIIRSSSLRIATPQDVTATEQDDDTLAIVPVTNRVSVVEGSTGTIPVRLSHIPLSPVTVTATWVSGDTNISVTGGNPLTFTVGGWDVAQDVTLTATEDDDEIAGEALIHLTSDGLSTQNVTAVEVDKDDPYFMTTEIQVTTNVLVSNVRRLGLNMTDSYWGGAYLKVRGSMNFEGLECRQVHSGILYPDGFLSFKFNGDWEDPWASNVYMGAKFRVLSDPAVGEEGVLIDMSVRPADIWQNGTITTQAFFEFDQPLTSSVSSNGVRDVGLLIVGTNLQSQGYMGSTNYHWNSGCEIVLDDVPSNSFGNASGRMSPGDELRVLGIYDTQSVISGGVFQISFYIKAESGSPEFGFDLDSSGGNNPTVPVLSIATNWEYRAYTITNLSASLTPVFENTGASGSILIDDILFEQIGQTNNSSYRDESVDLFKNDLNIGIMRYVQMGGWSIEDQIRPWNQMHNYKGSIGSVPSVYDPTPTNKTYEAGYNAKMKINIPDLCSASEAVGCIPWICISGTIYPDEMNTLIEFLAGPTNTAWGAFRAETYNHSLPYTDTLDEIIIEIGNEAWNLATAYNAKGYNGPNYWHDCIEVAKSNPSYNSKIKLSTAGQNFSTLSSTRILADATNSDYFAIAPYVVHGIDSFEFEVLDSTLAFTNEAAQENLFKWFMAVPMYHTYDTGMPEQYAVSTNTGVEFSFYEYNYHCTSGDAPTWPRRLFTASLGHGVSMANYSLANLKAYGVRNQCYFTAFQRNAYEAGLWGSMLNLRSDQRQHRPVAYANSLANKVRTGNLMETLHVGDNPTFQIDGYFDDVVETRSYDEIYSYAFQSGNGTNGLVLFNYGLDNTQKVRILLQEYVQNDQAECWRLSASSYTNANEGTTTNDYVDIVPEPVQPTNYTVSGFASGYELMMEPCSQYVFQWVNEGDFPNIAVSASEITVPEGGNAQFTVSLTAEPIRGSVTVDVARVSGDTNITVQSGSPAVLTTTNWNTGVLITLAASQDDDTDNDDAYIRCSAPGALSQTVKATEGENDLGIVLSTNEVSVLENSTNTFFIQVSMAPASPVTVTVARVEGGDTNLSVFGNSAFTFDSGNWNVDQMVTLEAASDPDTGNGEATFACSAPGVATQTVTATENDIDTVTLLVSPHFLEIPEGSSNATFALRLSAIPLANSTVLVSRVSGGDTNLTVSSNATLVFGPTNWNVDQVVTLSALEDPDQKNGDATFRCTPEFPNTKGPVDVVAIEVDNDFTSTTSLQDGVNGYTGTADSYISDYNQSANYGTVSLGHADAKRLPVIGWDLTSLSSTGYVDSVTIQLAAKWSAGSEAYNIAYELSVYALKQSWLEGDGSTTGVTWNTTDGGTAWQTGGAKGANDRGVLVGTVTVPEFVDANDHPLLINLNDAGVAYVRNAITNSSENYGFIFDDDSQTTARRRFYLKETSTVGLRPKLTVYYAESADAQITVSSQELTIPEAGSNSFNVALTRAPLSSVTVSVARASGSTNISVSGENSLVFTTIDWNQWKPVTLFASNDGNWTNDVAIISCSSPGMSNVNVTATEIDGDTDPTYSLPWSETFETNSPMAGTLRNLDGQHGWSVSGSGSALVQTGMVHGGTQALSITDATASHTFLGSPTTAEVTFWMDPEFATEPLTISSNASAVFYVNTNNLLVAYDATSGTELTGVTVSNGWNKFAVSCDYISNVWNLELNDALVVSNFSFYGAPTGFSNFSFFEMSSNTTSYVDDITTDTFVEIVVSTNAVTVPEGSTGVFEVKLDNNPLTPRTVTVAHFGGDTDITVNAGSSNLFFNSSNWSNYQAVTLSAAQDDGDWTNDFATIRCSAAGMINVDVRATEDDDDTDPDYTMPWRETFETNSPMAGTLGTLDGQHGWSVSGSGAALVQTGTVHRGAQALSVSNAVVSHTFLGSATNVWTTFWMNPEAGFAPETISSNASAVFYVNTNNLLVAYDSTNATEMAGVTVSNGWNKFAVHSDYSSNVWNLELNGTQVVSNFSFYGAPTGFGKISFIEPSSNFTIYVDDITVVTAVSEIMVSTHALGVAEGSSNTFSVKLTAEPFEETTITVDRAGGDGDITVSGGSNLVFNSGNWDVYRTVTLNAADDDDAVNSPATIQCSGLDLASVSVTATEIDDDSLEMDVTTSTLNVSEGSSNTFGVKLLAQPLADTTVIVARVGGDTNITVDAGSSSLVFNSGNWSSNQTVTLSASEDDDAADSDAFIQCSSVGMSNVTVTATETDNDTLEMSATTLELSVPEGSTNTFGIKLTAQPLVDTTVTVARVAGGDTDITVSGGSNLVFNTSNWSSYKTVTLHAAQDDEDWTNDFATIRCSSAGMTNVDVKATEEDDDTNPAYSLPWSETFETNSPMAGTLGTLDGQHGWSVSGSGSALVQTGTVYRGAQALSVTDAVASHTFLGSPTNVWAIFWMKATPTLAPENISSNASAVFYVNTNNLLVAYDSTNATEMAGVTVSNGWNKFAVHSDYISNVWNLELNDTLVVSNFSLYGSPTGFSQVSFTEMSGSSTAYVDDLTILETLIDITVSTNTLDVAEGSSNTFDVKLTAQPPEGTVVTVARVSGDSDITVSDGSNLVFNSDNWGVYKTVTLSAAADDDAANSEATIQCSIAGLASVSVTATEVDDDSLEMEATTSSVSVPEGSTNTFGVKLTAQPLVDTTVTVARVAGGDTNITVDAGSSSLVFNSSNWSSYRTVTLSASADEDWTNDFATIRCSSAGMTNVDVTATEDDDDTDPVYGLPWNETFETNSPMAGTLGDLDGQRGWGVTGSGAALVQAGAVHSGAQAMSLSNAVAEHTFNGSPSDASVTFWAQMITGDAPETISSNASAVFYVKTNDLIMAYDSTNATEVAGATVSNGWNKFTVSCDYGSDLWSLELNDTLVVSNFSFYGTPAAFGKVSFAGTSSNAVAYIDDITVTNSAGGGGKSMAMSTSIDVGSFDGASLVGGVGSMIQITVTLEEGVNLIGVNLEAENLAALLGNQLMAIDQVILYDAIASEYQTYTAPEAPELVVPAGGAFWIETALPREIVLTGRQLSSKNMLLLEGLQIVANPIFQEAALQDLNLPGTGSANPGLCDKVSVMVDGVYQIYGLGTDGVWYRANDKKIWRQKVLSEKVIETGEGFWYDAQKPFIWIAE